MNSAPALEHDRQTYEHHIFAIAASSISSKLCMVVEDVVPIIKKYNHFSIQ